MPFCYSETGHLSLSPQRTVNIPGILLRRPPPSRRSTDCKQPAGAPSLLSTLFLAPVHTRALPETVVLVVPVVPVVVVVVVVVVPRHQRQSS